MSHTRLIVTTITEKDYTICFQGVKEITLLGQNVNSYCDRSTLTIPAEEKIKTSKGFNTIYRAKKSGLTFADLLEKVAQIDPEIRVRFTSPHPKDFPDEVNVEQVNAMSSEREYIFD